MVGPALQRHKRMWIFKDRMEEEEKGRVWRPVVIKGI